MTLALSVLSSFGLARRWWSAGGIFYSLVAGTRAFFHSAQMGWEVLQLYFPVYE